MMQRNYKFFYETWLYHRDNALFFLIIIVVVVV
jgi:hypothetical protein